MKKLLYIFLSFSLVLISSCSSDKTDVISSSKMEDILYDFHLAQGMDGEGSAEDKAVMEIRNREAILRKHGVTDAEWDSSYNYYCRHSQELYEIYKNLSDRVRNELTAMGGTVSSVEGEMTGDTADVWNADRDFVLMQHVPYNIKSFDIIADTTYKAGDRLILKFDTKYIFQDGMRDLVAVLSVTLGNDSVTTETRHVSMDGMTSVSIGDTKKLGIKEIRGYFILTRNINDVASTTLRLASVFNVSLIRMHDNQPPVDSQTSDADSSKVTPKDSVPPSEGNRQGMLKPDETSDAALPRPSVNGVPPAPPARPARPLRTDPKQVK